MKKFISSLIKDPDFLMIDNPYVPISYCLHNKTCLPVGQKKKKINYNNAHVK